MAGYKTKSVDVGESPGQAGQRQKLKQREAEQYGSPQWKKLQALRKAKESGKGKKTGLLKKGSAAAAGMKIGLGTKAKNRYGN